MDAPDKIIVAPHQVFDYDLDIQAVGHNGAEEYIRKDAVLEWANVHKQAICINGNEESAYDRGQYSVILALIDKLQSL